MNINFIYFNKMSELEQKELIKTKKGKILETLLIEKSFKEDGIIIRKWEGEPDAKDYISEIKKGYIHFIGVLVSNLVKKGYGYIFQITKIMSVCMKMISIPNMVYINIQIKLKGIKLKENFFQCF